MCGTMNCRSVGVVAGCFHAAIATLGFQDHSNNGGSVKAIKTMVVGSLGAICFDAFRAARMVGDQVTPSRIVTAGTWRLFQRTRPFWQRELTAAWPDAVFSLRELGGVKLWETKPTE